MCRHVASLLSMVWVMGVVVELLAQEAPKSPATVAAKGSQGTFSIGGGTYKLMHAVAYEAKVFDDEYMIHVLASSEPIAVEKLKTALRDGKGSDDKFITFQPQVKLTFNKKSGEVSFCNANAKGSSISVSGGGLTGTLAVKEGRVIGKAALKSDKGDDRGSFDVQFDLELIAAIIVPDDKPTKKEKSKGTTKGKEDSSDEDSKPKKGKATADSINVYDLPIPKDATDIERKKLVEHIHFKSPSDVKTVTDFLIKQFDEQKWSKTGADLAAPKSSILNRTKGASSLTIFVKPGDKGSTVTIMTRGLSWEEKKPAADGEPKEVAAAGPGIPASKFPVPDKATDVERNADTEMVTLRSQLSAKELIGFYGKSLTKLGWKENKDETLLIEEVETGSMNFAKGDDSLQIVIQDGKPKSRTRVVVIGSGLKWAEASDEKSPDSAKPEKDKQ
ncbi:MAG: hypothetical protein AABP62_24645 [Planctomycetota bacterium]